MSPPSRAPAPSFATLPRLEDPPATVLDHLDRRFPHVGRAVWEARIAEGKTTFDDGCALAADTPYRAGARVRYFREVAAEPEIPFAAEILYRDERLLVADKPHFLPVTPSGPYVKECLIYRLRAETGLDELQPVHRLDRETAGLVLCAAHKEMRGSYSELFMRGRIEKQYLAVARVSRVPEGKVWEVENRIVSGEPWFRMKVVPGTPNASSRIELVEASAGLGLFRLSPRTGKTHQLRLHMAALGFPILNDRIYPELRAEAPPDFSRPLQLLARELRWRDPTNGEELSFRSRQHLPWPRRL